MTIYFDNGKELRISSILCDVEPRFLEDAMVKLENSDNFVEDMTFEDQISGKKSKMPLMEYFEQDKSYHWRFTIDVIEGRILDWKYGIEANVNYKVCDQGKYRYYDSNHRLVVEYNGYVPDILSIGAKGFGDYIIMHINEYGEIEGWKNNTEIVRETIKKDLLKHGYQP